MIGAKIGFPGKSELCFDLALHVVNHRPHLFPDDVDTAMIIKNAWSYTQTHDLNPSAFANFCEEIQHKINEIRELVSQCENSPSTIGVYELSLVKMIMNNSNQQVNERIARAFQTVYTPPDLQAIVRAKEQQYLASKAAIHNQAPSRRRQRNGLNPVKGA
jgi:hypothetical protein